MNRCPITYEDCADQPYSKKGLRLLSKNLLELHPFPYTAQEQLQIASQMQEKLSIQGVQPKLSGKLNISKSIFEIVGVGGTYILKPPHQIYIELPQNEDLSMKLASLVGIEVPLHGMIYNIDRSLTYFVKRFDRLSKNQKIALEDLSQLTGFSRDTKYDSSMEKVALAIEANCTFPLLEKIKLFRRVIFNFLIGNEDMHLKNFSLIQRRDKVELSPAYDLLNTTIVLKAKEEIALPIRGKKSNLTEADLIGYYASERLGLSREIIDTELLNFSNALPSWKELIANSFLSPRLQKAYLELLNSRFQRLKL